MTLWRRTPRAGLVAGLLLTLAACAGPGQGPRSMARAFLDTHYVAIDLVAARELTVSLALNKIDREIELTQGMVIDADTAKPRINYRLERFEEAELVARYVYELTIRAPGLEPYQKFVTLVLRLTGDEWRVTNYSEVDP